jgi:hypothetical protein
MTAAAAPAGTAGRRRMLAAAAVAVALAAGATAVAGSGWVRGWALYHGHLEAAGRIMGHGADLPPAAARCANCHDAAPGAGLARRSIAPLDRASLTEARPRRGGPPSAYTSESFCAVVRGGIDPAMVMVNRTMPRFDMPDADCAALWTYVSSR